MSHQKKGIRLPYALERELGLDLRTARQNGRHSRVPQDGGRKEQRRAQRVEKKALRGRGGRDFVRMPSHRGCKASEDEDVETNAGGKSRPGKQMKDMRAASEPSSSNVANPEPKSILKKPPKLQPSSPLYSDASSRSSSPGLVLDANSQSFRDRAAQDDAEISALEKRLGLKKRKLPKSFDEDGLGGLLDGLDEEDEGQTHKKQGLEWLEKKRRKAQQSSPESTAEEDSEIESEMLLDKSDDSGSGSDNASERSFSTAESLDKSAEDDRATDDDVDVFSGFESDEAEEDLKPNQPTKTRENPYVAPVSSTASAAKYIPPSLRKLQGSDGQLLERLRRQIQGHLNKLSEANLISILGEIEKIYQSNPRQDATSMLIDLLLSLFCNRSTLPNTFVILHAAFATAVYKVIGTDFGAELVAKLTERFEVHHVEAANGKESLNLLSLLSNLFTFHLISSTLIVDHVCILLEELSETNTELLLRVIRDCGPQLRQDDPSALKNIVQMMQTSIKRLVDQGQQTSVRTQFMMETIIDLKNNKMKEATNAAGATREHITRMRKVLGSLNSRNLRASEPLRISRNDIKNSDKKGKWWLVGASWKGNDAEGQDSFTQEADLVHNVEHDPDDEEVDLVSLAREYRMNTDVRRSIFVAIMSAYNYQDGYLRIMKLRLKRSQEPEIAKVLLRCAGSENISNPYYGLLAKRLCSDKRISKTFEFALWDFFKRMGERQDDDDEQDIEDEDVEIEEIASLAKMFAFLITESVLSVGVLRVLDLALLKEQGQMFVEFLLVTTLVLCKGDETTVARVFDRAAETPQVIPRLQLFVKNHVRKSDLIQNKDKDIVKRGCTVAMRTLESLSLQN